MRRRFRAPEVIRAWAIVVVRERGRSIEGLIAGVRELRLCLIGRGSCAHYIYSPLVLLTILQALVCVASSLGLLVLILARHRNRPVH